MKEQYITKFKSKQSDLPRANEEITTKEVRVITDDGEMLGVMPVTRALELAAERSLDLVEVSPTASPPVCKIMDFGKYKYQTQKRAQDARKKQKVIVIKEIKIRPNIGENDYQVKLRNLQKFIEEGNKVRVTLRFRGREVAHSDLALKLLERMRDDVLEIAKIEVPPKMEGKQMVMMLAPK